MNSPQPGFVRDLTSQFANHRRSRVANGLGGGIGSALLESDSTETPVLFQTATAIASRFADIESKLDELRNLYSRRFTALNGFSDEQQIEDNITALTQNISRTMEGLREDIKNELSNTNDAQIRAMEANLQKGHKTRLQDLTFTLRIMQQEYVEKLQSRSNALLESSMDRGFDDPDIDFTISFTGDQNLQLVSNEIILREQNAMMEYNNRMAHEICEMTTDFQAMIFEQGLTVDRIDSHIAEAMDEMLDGNEELDKAEKHQSKGEKCFYIYILCSLIVIFITGTVILVKKNKIKNQQSEATATPAAAQIAAASLIALSKLFK